MTIREIAKTAGVSISTVSLVMNGKAKASRIHPDTEKRIVQLAQQFNYVPNKNARRFRLKRSDTFGFIVPDATNPFFSSLSYALEMELKQRGYQLLIGYSDDQVEIEAEIMQNLLSYSIDGLIIASAANTDQVVQGIKGGGIPAVFIDREIHSKNISSISSDNFLGAFEAVNYVCSRGVRDIYHIGGLAKFSTTRHRAEGYIKALENNGIPIDETKIFLRDYQMSSGFQMMREIFQKNGSLPQAVFTGSYSLLEGCLRFIYEIYQTIPPDIAIVTFDDHPLLDFIPNKIISVRQDTEQLAKSAVQVILDILQGSAYAENLKIKPKLIIRT
ncbi:MAG: LacI family transcriptional regulator [Calditrichaeota bacterium]|nr:MAG: LacI family transcriptional regulator [Calditrichota bacterium]